MTSMTGHGRGEARSGGWKAIVECFSVNRKNAEIVCHADRGSAWVEPVVREHALPRIARGRLQVNVTLESDAAAAGHLIDAARAAAFTTEARALAKKLGLAGDVTLSDVLAAPGVLREQEASNDGAREALLAALDLAMDALCAARTREGAALRKVLARSLKNLSAVTRKISSETKGATSAHREELLRRIAKAGLPVSSDDPRLVTEIALFAERCDITEELDRLGSHLAQFTEKLDAGGVIGRTLEFLTQELGREFNTISSKSASAAIARLVIEAKTELDRIREQLANIE